MWSNDLDSTGQRQWDLSEAQCSDCCCSVFEMSTYDDEWLTATGWWATANGAACTLCTNGLCTNGLCTLCTNGEPTTTPGAGAAAATAKMQETTNYNFFFVRIEKQKFNKTRQRKKVIFSFDGCWFSFTLHDSAHRPVSTEHCVYFFRSLSNGQKPILDVFFSTTWWHL